MAIINKFASQSDAVAFATQMEEFINTIAPYNFTSLIYIGGGSSLKAASNYKGKIQRITFMKKNAALRKELWEKSSNHTGWQKQPQTPTTPNNLEYLYIKECKGGIYKVYLRAYPLYSTKGGAFHNYGVVDKLGKITKFFSNQEWLDWKQENYLPSKLGKVDEPTKVIYIDLEKIISIGGYNL